MLEAGLDAFAQALRRENHTLKRALTDPHVFSGIGNAYSDEILHAARLSPFKQTQSLGDDEVARLFEAVRATLVGWSARLREETGDGFPEKVTAFREGMAVHGRYRQPCPVCGSPVQRVVYAANEANYCATCQTGGRLLADRSLSRLLREDWPRTLEELERRRAPKAGRGFSPYDLADAGRSCRRRHRVRLPAAPALAAQDAGVLRFGGDAEGGAPFVEADPRDPSRVVGFEVDVAALLAAGLGRTPRFVQVGFTTLDPAVERGDFDIGLSGTRGPPGRRARLAVTVPYYEFREVLTVRQSDAARLTSLAALRGRRVATLGATLASDLLDRAREEHGVVPVIYEDDVHPYTDLAVGRVDAVLLDAVLADRGVSRNPGLVNQPADMGVGHYVGTLAPENAALRDRIDGLLRAAMRDGRLEAIFRKWRMWNDDQPRLYARVLAAESGSKDPDPRSGGGPKRRRRRPRIGGWRRPSAICPRCCARRSSRCCSRASRWRWPWAPASRSRPAASTEARPSARCSPRGWSWCAARRSCCSSSSSTSGSSRSCSSRRWPRRCWGWG